MPHVITEEESKEIQRRMAQLIIPQQSKPVRSFDYNAILSPQTFDQYIGQTEAKELAQIMVTAARNEHRQLPNILIVGEYGLGKTSLARVIMRAYGASDRLIDGASVNRELPEDGSVIIDEIHNLNPEVADTLNLALDQGNLTIIGATTDSGALPSAFRSRFRTLFLEDYQPEELEQILRNICVRRNTKATPNAIKALSLRARFNARHAIMLLQMAFDIMSVKNKKELTEEIADETLSKLGIDDQGFLPRDRRYLSALPSDRPVGLSYLSAILGIDETTIQEEVEPYLMRMGLIDRTQRGRIKIGI